jgi:hypothetical protein
MIVIQRADVVGDLALKKYGGELQLAKAFEEMGELIVALSRIENGGIKTNSVIDEIADVTIMLRQLRSMFGPDAVDERIKFKLDRLLNKIQGTQTENVPPDETI